MASKKSYTLHVSNKLSHRAQEFMDPKHIVTTCTSSYNIKLFQETELLH